MAGADSASLSSDLSGRLELHCRAVHSVHRLKPGKSQKQLLWCTFYVSLYGAVYYFSLDRLYGVLQLCVFLSVPLLRLYNGARSKNAALSRVMKPLFYLYYPLHLFLIGLIRTFFLS